jgi:hypothetical protein
MKFGEMNGIKELESRKTFLETQIPVLTCSQDLEEHVSGQGVVTVHKESRKCLQLPPMIRKYWENNKRGRCHTHDRRLYSGG